MQLATKQEVLLVRETQADSHIFSSGECRPQAALAPHYISAIEIAPAGSSGLSSKLLELQRERESEKVKYAMLKERLSAKIVECRELKDLLLVIKPTHYR